MRGHVARNFSLKFSHMRAACHQIRDLLAAFLALAEISGFGPFNQHGKVVTNRKGMNDVMGDENNRNALLARLQDNTQHSGGKFVPFTIYTRKNLPDASN